MAWNCPECHAAAVHSLVETRRVFNWRAIFGERYRALAERLRRYRVAPEAEEDAREWVKRWVGGDVADAPGYVCLACASPWSDREVPA